MQELLIVFLFFSAILISFTPLLLQKAIVKSSPGSPNMIPWDIKSDYTKQPFFSIDNNLFGYENNLTFNPTNPFCELDIYYRTPVFALYLSL